MAISAFVLVHVSGNHTKSALKTMTRMEGVMSVYSVTGSHDIISQTQAEDIQGLSELIAKIRSIDGVIKTETSIVLTL